jgi:hypothetical protein
MTHVKQCSTQYDSVWYGDDSVELIRNQYGVFEVWMHYERSIYIATLPEGMENYWEFFIPDMWEDMLATRV